MADGAPRSVPPYGRQNIHRQWWYCLYCRQQTVLEADIRVHVRAAHMEPDVNPEKGEDYTNGDHLFILLDRWEKYSLLAADHFVTQLDSLRGADDFVFEVGEGVRDA